MLYVQSTKYPLLQSQALAFQIGDGISPAQIGGNPSTPAPLLDPFSANPDGDPTTLPAPRPPLLSSVGDGFVALVASDATQPTTVTLQGSGFQAGGAVVVDVDGLQTSLSPASVSENQVQVQLPPALFKLRTYTFDFQVNLQNLNPGNPPLHAQQQNNSGKVIFRDRPLYAAAEPNYRLGGFHPRNPQKTNHPDPFNYYLMVPEQTRCPPSPSPLQASRVHPHHPPHP